MNMDELARARDRRKPLHPIGIRPGCGARHEQSMNAARLRMFQADVRAGRVPVVKERLTRALDIAGLFGPAVDAACGVEEPTVDLWESGDLTPTAAQVRAVARLTGFAFWWFYLPEDPIGHVFICEIP